MITDRGMFRLDFEDTYDGLGDQLDETDDAFNDDTFGGEESSSKPQHPVGKDFDFFGQTAKVADAISEEQVRFSRQQPAPKIAPQTSAFVQPYSKPARSGYERYKEPTYLPDLQADADLWGTTPKSTKPEVQNVAPQTSTGRKMMSLEEVEAAMRAQAKKPAPAPPAPAQQSVNEPQIMAYQQQQPQHYQPYPQQMPPQYSQPQPGYGGPEFDTARREQPAHPQEPMQPSHPVQILQRAQAHPTQPSVSPAPSQPKTRPPPSPQPQQQVQQQPMQILQNPNRLSIDGQRQSPSIQPMQPQPQPGSGPRPGHRHTGSIITHPQQLANLTEEDRAAYLLEDAKRAKRNHKIFLLSKDNGLMTPQDKNFITRIQLQQLVTATGNPNEHGTDAALSEDFYYQVHNQIRGGPRQHPGQPLSNFAQTYLFQTGGRHGGMRRQARGGDNHMQRMEQQVQRAVEAAKNKPKNKQLVIEGSLGKISFSNAKTPKPLLNIKRAEGGNEPNRPKTQQTAVSGTDRKTVLRDIENVYATLMQMEDHDRKMPTPLTDDVNPTLLGMHMEWREVAGKLNQQLWQELKVHEPIGATTTHPFIAFLSFSKGKKAIPRVFRHITQEQRTTILTIIVVHLDQLDVVRQAQLAPGETQLSASIRENVELFSLAVMPSLFGYLSEAGLEIVDGILNLILARTNVDVDARTRIGVSMLTMILSRAELIKQAGNVDERDWEHWYIPQFLILTS